MTVLTVSSNCSKICRCICTCTGSAGGVREAFFSTEYYKLVWGKRIGFAKVATEAHVVSYMFCLYSNFDFDISRENMLLKTSY